MARTTDDLNSLTEAERLRLAQGVSPEERLRREGSLLSEEERQALADPALSGTEPRPMGGATAAAPSPSASGFGLGGSTVSAGLSEAERLRIAEQASQAGVIERIEERPVIGKVIRDTGGVRVTTRTELVNEAVRTTLTETVVEVEHVPVGRFVEATEEPRVEGDVTVVPVYEERLVVEKRLYLVEEVHLRRVARANEVDVPVELRKQAVVVERVPPRDDPSQVSDT
jgi:stress response protein YsnF